jgi:hypothetical protein
MPKKMGSHKNGKKKSNMSKKKNELNPEMKDGRAVVP